MGRSNGQAQYNNIVPKTYLGRIRSRVLGHWFRWFNWRSWRTCLTIWKWG